ncbi:hypothetical protein GJ689_24820 [Rhodoplanes serenus]|uniref:Uncharacterized protein n=1 Tax=Rhodoplanes serenus TaxID=200615 RepID=A0A9X4XQ90_9BRAD|nr:hypothetical protein [Rhodoplanes serenus]MTW19418.1 hypothetical protein [Rhodoplanes serenus]
MADIHLITSSMHRPPQGWPDGHSAEVVSLMEQRQIQIVRRAARRRIDPSSPWWSIRHDMDPEPPSDVQCRPSAPSETIAREAVATLPQPTKHLGAVCCDPFDPTNGDAA